jgi:hypothetical protein
VTTSAPAVDIVNLDPPAELDADRAAWLVDGLVAALPSLRLRELFALRRDMFTEADLITVAVDQQSDAVVGALCSRWDTTRRGTRFLHVTTQFVGDDYRHGEVFRHSWATHLETICAGPAGFPAVTALKTYNPMVFCAMRALSRVDQVGFYPELDPAADVPPGVATLAEEIAAAIAPGHRFDPRTGVISGVGVPADLYPRLPQSSDPAVNEHFRRTTGPDDRVLCLLTVPTPQAVGDVLRRFVRAGRSQTPPANRPEQLNAARLVGLPAPHGIPGTEL